MTAKAKSIVVPMTEAEGGSHLTDHEWRLNQAAEGKAIYVTNQAAEEKMAGKKTAGEEITLTLTDEDAQAFHRAADDAEYLFAVTGTFLETLRLGISGGFLSGDENGLNALLELGRRGMHHAEEHEGRVLGRLGMRFRDLGVDCAKEV